MKKIILICVWTTFWIVLESTWLRSFPADQIRLDIVFISIVAISFIMDYGEGIAPVALMGLISDAISPAPFGIITTTYLATFILLRFATSIIYLQSITARLVWTISASIVAIWLKALILSLFYKTPQFLVLALWRSAPQAIWNGIIAIAVIPLFLWYIDLDWRKLIRSKGLVLK